MPERGGQPLLEVSADVLLDACFASAPVGFGVLDEDLRWVRANRALADLSGLPSGDCAGRSLAEAGGGLAEHLEPLVRRALEGEPAADVAVAAGDDRKLRVSCFPLSDGAGARGVGVVVVEGDSEHVRLSMRLSEERLRLALEGTQTGTWEWDRATDAVAWSSTVGPLFGLPRGSAPPGYEEYLQLVHPDDRAALAEAVRAATQEGADYRREFRALQPDGSYRWLSSHAHALHDDHGELVCLVGLITDVHDRRERELAAEFLARATMVLSGSQQPEAMLQQLADLAVPDLADWCVVHLGEADEPLAVAHRDAVAERSATERRAAVVQSGRAELLPEGHAMVVPLRTGDRTLGTITFGTGESGRVFGQGSLALAEELGRRAGLVIDNALVHRSEREALHRLEQLQAIADVGLSHLELDDLLRELLRRIAQLTESPDAAVLLLDESERCLRVGAAVGLTVAARHEIEVPLGEGVAGTIASRRQPRLIDDLTQVQVHSDFLRRSARSLIGAPLVDGDTVIGVLRVTSPNPGAFTPGDLDLLQLVADRAARAISHARLYDQARSTALTLQRALLPGVMPDAPGLEVASRYLPGHGGAEVGGDWYDVFLAGDGRLVIVVGDTVGRGVRAAAVMGQMRNALRAYAYEDSDPASALVRIDRLIDSGTIEVEFATACVCTVDLGSRRLTLATAGHPPPVLAAGGTAEILDAVADLPLGADAGERHRVTRTLPPDGILVLYTDGLVERRDRPLTDGFNTLLGAVAGAHPTAEAVLDAVLEAGRPDEAAADDVAVLAVRIT